MDRDLENFVSYLIGRGLSRNSIVASDVKSFLESGKTLKEWFTLLKDKGLKNKTLARKRSSLSLYFKWLGESVELPKIKPEKTLPIVLNEIESRALLEASTKTRNPKRDRLIIELFLKAGLRVGELLSLRPRDIEEDQDIHFIRIIQGKGSKDRRIPLVDKRLIRELKSYIKEIPDDERIFPLTARRIEYLVKYIAKKAGITKEVHPHTLRHTAATLYLKRGVNIESVRKTLGHTNLSTTQIYLQLTDFDVAKDLARAQW